MTEENIFKDRLVETYVNISNNAVGSTSKNMNNNSYHLLSVYYVAGISLSILDVLTHFILITIFMR